MKTFQLFVCFCFLNFNLIFCQTALDVNRISITVSSLEKILPFYEEVLNFKQVDKYQISNKETQKLFGLQNNAITAKVAVLQLGNEKIELLEFLDEEHQRPIPYDSRSNDLWFQHIAIVVSDIDAAYKRLRTYKVKHVSTAPQTLPEYLPAAAGISAFYFRDPDGHNLELIHFPKGKGDPKWQTKTDALFLGIDHTAIGIEETDNSNLFYKEILGLSIAGDSENYGTEQEHLNQVFGAHLLITGLKAKNGIGVEYLQYLAPPGGRPFPEDSVPTDLWHWHTTVEVENATKIYQQLQNKNYPIISNGLVQSSNALSFLVRGPNHHAILIIEHLKNK